MEIPLVYQISLLLVFLSSIVLAQGRKYLKIVDTVTDEEREQFFNSFAISDVI